LPEGFSSAGFSPVVLDFSSFIMVPAPSEPAGLSVDGLEDVVPLEVEPEGLEDVVPDGLEVEPEGSEDVVPDGLEVVPEGLEDEVPDGLEGSEGLTGAVVPVP
jgi:hypothetical protein